MAIDCDYVKAELSADGAADLDHWAASDGVDACDIIIEHHYRFVRERSRRGDSHSDPEFVQDFDDTIAENFGRA